MAAAWIAAAVSLLGAVLAYLGARQGSRPDQEAVTQSERDEWGRRFTTAIDMIADGAEQRVAVVEDHEHDAGAAE